MLFLAGFPCIYILWDLGGNDIVMWTADPGVLEFLCNLDANCLGFNSNGSLKYPPLQVGSSDGITLWIKPSSQ